MNSYKRLVKHLRESWDPGLWLWIDILLARKLFVVSVPTNLNYWRPQKSLTKFISMKEPITIVDVGSRGAPPPEFQQIRPFSRYIGFDASDTAQEHSPSHKRGWQDYRISQAFIGQPSAEIEFNNYSDGGLSSMYEPNYDYSKEFSPSTAVESRVQISTVSLSEALGRELSQVDFLKLDTQGSELDILRTDGVSDIPLIEVETEFIEVYRGQPLFGEIFGYMISKGYRLLWLTRHQGSPHSSESLARGSLVFGEALFGFSTARASALPIVQFENYLTLLCVYGHADFAEYLLGLRKGLDDEICHRLTSLIALFSQGNKHTQGLRSRISTILEKIQFLIGIRRARHNQFDTDSDRSLFFR